MSQPHKDKKVKFVQIAMTSLDLGNEARLPIIALSDKGEIWSWGSNGKRVWTKLESPNEE